MGVKVSRIGGELVLSLPDKVIDALGLDEGSEVAFHVEPESLFVVIAPSSPNAEGVDIQFAEQVALFIRQYRLALDALALPDSRTTE